MIIASRIKQLRIDRQISQKELSDILEIGFSNISMYESGHRIPNNDNLKKLAIYFDCSIDYLLGLSDIPKCDLDIPSGYVAVVSDAIKDGISPSKLKKLIEFAKSLDGE